MSFFQIYQKQFIPTSPEKLWDFISSPLNLKKITPPNMGFDITTGNGQVKMYKGMIIGYKLKIMGLFPSNWVTEITQVVNGEFFVDEQRHGPYKMWHHEHSIYPKDSGCLMVDKITYIPPLGVFGRLLNKLFIKEQLAVIFEFRRTMLQEIFPEKKADNQEQLQISQNV